MELERLRKYRELAASAQTYPASSRPELKLHKGEEVLWEAGGVTMIEVADTVSLFGPVHSVFSPTLRGGGYADLRHAPESDRDSGHVVVTTQRVFFDGAKANREWAFAELNGVAHGTTVPMSLMRVANRQRLSGLVFDDSAYAMPFQFYLQLGLALHHNDRAGFLAHLAKLEADHHTAAAQPPAPPKRRRTNLILVPALLAAVVFLVCVIVAIAAPPTPKQSTSATNGLVPVQTTTSNPPTAVAPATSTATTPTATSAPAVVTAPTTTTAAPPPQPKPAPVHNFCGAPTNPWNYDFCSGGSTISNPPLDFCSYFDCIDSFWKNTNGYVMECQDHMFSHSGGRSGSCSYHGGNYRALKQH